MTPFALRLVRAYTAHPTGATMALRLCGATCFDITDVVEAVADASQELIKSFYMNGDDPHFDHGGLLFMPDDVVWVEWRYQGHRCGAFLNQFEDQIGFTFIKPDGEPLIGFLELHEDESFVIRFDLRTQGGHSKENQEFAGNAGGFTAAALMLINAPRGVKRITHEPHKGLRREMKRHGKPELRPYHVIKLDKAAGNIGGANGGGTPKGFHFCRAHLRQLPTGVTTKVRAHWRGDPALGICRATYKVAA